MAATVQIDRERSAERIDRDIETLAGHDYTLSQTAIRRYAYTDVYRNTLAFFSRELEALGFEVAQDPVGNLVARNRPRGEKVFGIGSHCDSNRNGGKYDGTMGVVTALEVCRLNAELGLDLPLQLISFLEEEGSGFGQALLGSRIVAQTVTEQDLRETLLALDDGRPFWEHARDAGYEPERWLECRQILDDLIGWIELHIEQGRVLEDAGRPIGIVEAIAGYTHGDIVVTGRADHAGATPMPLRADALAAAAEIVLAVEEIARAAGAGVVGTVGQIAATPGAINIIPGTAAMSLDVRSTNADAFDGAVARILGRAEEVARRRCVEVAFSRRQRLEPVQLDATVIDALARAADSSGAPWEPMSSGAAHDTMCVARRAPSAMVFVPCAAGVSHSPLEQADPDDAALGVEVIVNALLGLIEPRDIATAR